MSQSPPPILYAEPQHVGEICPVCGEAVREHQLVRVVNGVVHHHRCWEGHASGSGAVQSSSPPTATAAGVAPFAGTPVSPLSVGTQAPESLPGAGGMITLLLLIGIIPILGPMLGIIFGFLWLDPAHPTVKRRDGKILIVLACVLFVLHIIACSCQLAEELRLMRSGTIPTQWP
jgi:hypothetical protein